MREAIKKNLADIVSEESIIMHDGRKVVSPHPTLDEYHFRFDSGKQKHGGRARAKASRETSFTRNRRGQGKGRAPG